jgi:exopolyphosphatase / guanosine-5'-triphosphate,3'-diphosphate pyrophosphatase
MPDAWRERDTERTSAHHMSATRVNRRFSVIDIGTNSARFVAVDPDDSGGWTVLAERREPCRLGEGLSASGMLGEIPAARAVAAVGTFSRLARELDAPIRRAVATQAVRSARNSADFLDQIAREAGVEVQIISPTVESRLAYRATARAAGVDRGRLAVVDMGGGSVQIVVGIGGVPVAAVSMPIGAVAVTERFGGPDLSAGERFDDLRASVASAVGDALESLPFIPRKVLGVGGGCSSAAMLAASFRDGAFVAPAVGRTEPERSAGASRSKPPSAASGAVVTPAHADAMLTAIRAMTPAERGAIPGMSVERSQIIVAGLATIASVLRAMKATSMDVPMSSASGTSGGAGVVGVRDGLVIEAIESGDPSQARAEATETRIGGWRERAIAFGRRSRFEEEHATHVARLAVGLHGTLAALAEQGSLKKGRWRRERSRDLLEAAALLHDVGVAVSYKRHHRHSASMISINGAAGFDEREVAIIAAIARYHRKSLPRARHAEFEGLSGKDRRLVRRLAGILRVADAFDRSHCQVVRGITAQIDDGEITFRAACATHPVRELHAAAEKSDLFERAFGVDATVTWQPPRTKATA